MVRLPLQIGTSSLWSLARSVGMFFPSLVVLTAAGLSLAGYGGGWVTLGIVGALMLVYSIVQASRAWRTRPSDAVLDESGLRLEGGAHAGLQIGWKEIDGAKTRAETTREARVTVRVVLSTILGALLADKASPHETDRVPVRRLHLVSKDGRSWDLAEAELAAEAESLDALLGSIRSKLRPPEKRARAASQEVIVCGSCGAPAPPVDSDHVACRYCGAGVGMPDAVRERLRAHRAMQASRAQVTRVVEKLLRQPRAGWASIVLVIAGVFCSMAWLAVVLGLLVLGPTSAGIFEVSWSLAGGLFATAAFFIMARAALANRRALHLLASSFGARPPRDDSGVHSCRRCSAPLPASESLVVQCAYCSADNLLGLDLRHEVEPTQAHRWDLEKVLQTRRTEQLVWVLACFGACLLVALSVIMAIVSVVTAQEFEAERQRCEGGDAQACYSLGVDYELGISGAQNQQRAFDAYQKSCELGHAEACAELSGWYLLGQGEVPEDQHKGVALLERACELDHAESCLEASYWYYLGREQIAEDKERAAKLRARACSLGLKKACEALR